MKRWDRGSNQLITIVIVLLSVAILVLVGVQFWPRGAPSHSESTRPGEDVSYLKNKKELLTASYFKAMRARLEGETGAILLGDDERLARLRREEHEAKRDLDAFELEMRARNNGQLPAWWGKE